MSKVEPDNTGKKLTKFQAGSDWTGNAAGRPKGSRNKLGEEFIAKMYEDFQQHGVAVIEQVRLDKPDQYLKVIASMLPKELHITEHSLADMPDNELVEYYAAVRSLAASINGKAAQVRTRPPRRDPAAGKQPH